MTNSTTSRKAGLPNEQRRARLSAVKAAGVRLAAVFFWLLVWQAASVWIGQELLLVSPLTAARTLLRLMGEGEFYRSIAHSLLRVLWGFSMGALLGVLLAALSLVLPPADALLGPLMHAIKATPVASFVILALIFVRSRYLSVLMAFLMVLPILYTNVLTGLKGADGKLLEMARVFRMRPGARIRAIYLPAAWPNFLSACALSLGMSWKAGIAAEVIGLPDATIGTALYQAKIFFSTPELFAWTLAIILLSVALERAVLFVAGRLGGRLEGGGE